MKNLLFSAIFHETVFNVIDEKIRSTYSERILDIKRLGGYDFKILYTYHFHLSKVIKLLRTTFSDHPEATDAILSIERENVALLFNYQNYILSFQDQYKEYLKMYHAKGERIEYAGQDALVKMISSIEAGLFFPTAKGADQYEYWKYEMNLSLSHDFQIAHKEFNQHYHINVALPDIQQSITCLFFPVRYPSVMRSLSGDSLSTQAKSN